MSKSETAGRGLAGGMSLLSWLFLIFVTLKLTGHIAWSWWWVTAPLWGQLVVIGLLLLTMGALILILKLMDK